MRGDQVKQKHIGAILNNHFELDLGLLDLDRLAISTRRTGSGDGDDLGSGQCRAQRTGHDLEAVTLKDDCLVRLSLRLARSRSAAPGRGGVVLEYLALRLDGLDQEQLSRLKKGDLSAALLCCFIPPENLQASLLRGECRGTCAPSSRPQCGLG